MYIPIGRPLPTFDAGEIRRFWDALTLGIALRPSLPDLGSIVPVAASGDRGAGTGHETLVIGEVIPGEQHCGKRFARLYEVVDVSARIVPRGAAIARLVDRPPIVRMAGVLHVEFAETCVGKTV